MSEKTSNTRMVAVISFLVQYLGKECRSESILLKNLKPVSHDVIYQKRVPVFHQGFQTPRNR